MKYILLILLLASCNVTKKTSGNSTTITITDTVRVSTYDTSKHIIETLDFQNKTVEVYDTVHITKDSVIYVLKTRTIYNDGKSKKELTQAGTGKDSVRIVTQYKEIVKTVEKQASRTSVWIALAVVLIICFAIYKVKL